MEKIQYEKHSKELLFYAFSKMFERASYYGIRALVILYMVGETLNIERAEALSIFGWVTGALVFSQIIGALFGDLLIGNKKTIIIGAFIQAFGAFSLCIPSMIGLYLGLSLIVLGSGFFTPNIISNFGKLYLNKTNLLDSGFTIFYLAINIGSFLGITLLGYIGEFYSYKIGFILSGILILLSIVPLIILKDEPLPKVEGSDFHIGKKIFNILIAVLLVGLFWSIYDIAIIGIFELEVRFSEISTLDIPNHLWQSFNSYFILPISLIVIFLWTHFYSSHYFKLMLGFIFGGLSYGLLFLIPEAITEKHTVIYFTSLFFLGISEVYIAPVIHSTLTKYSNPKYLAILISISFIPTRLFSIVFGFFQDRFYDDSLLSLKFGFIAMTVLGMGLFAYLFLNKNSTHNNV